MPCRRTALVIITLFLFVLLFLSGTAEAEEAKTIAAVYKGDSVAEITCGEEPLTKTAPAEETEIGMACSETIATLGMVAYTTGVSKVGDQFTLEVVLSEAKNVDGVAFEVKFDPAVLRIIKDKDGNSVTANPDIYKPDPPFNNPCYRADTEYSTRMDGFAFGIDFGSDPVWLGKIKFELLKEAETRVIFSYHKLSTPAPPPPGVPQPIPHVAEGCLLVFDFTPPLAEALIAPEEALAGSKVSLVAKGSDNVRLNYFRFEYSPDGSSWHLIGEGQPTWQESELLWRADYEWDTAGLALGGYFIRVAFRDPGGHEAALETTFLLTGSVKGEVYLEGVPPDYDRSGIKVYLEGTNIQATTDAGGYYNLGGVPAGEYRLIAAKLGFLDQAEKVGITAETPHLVALVLTLLTGDITGDNVVDLDDVLVMRQDYGKPIQRSDLNRSGLVGIRDLVLLARNYTKCGATYR